MAHSLIYTQGKLMAIDILLDDNGDIDISGGIMRLTPDLITSAKQQVAIVLRCYKGEWTFNISFGIPYIANDNNPQQLLGAGDNKNLLDALIKKEILRRENVVDIISYSSTLDRINNYLEVEFKFTAPDGTVADISLEASI